MRASLLPFAGFFSLLFCLGNAGFGDYDDLGEDYGALDDHQVARINIDPAPEPDRLSPLADTVLAEVIIFLIADRKEFAALRQVNKRINQLIEPRAPDLEHWGAHSKIVMYWMTQRGIAVGESGGRLDYEGAYQAMLAAGALSADIRHRIAHRSWWRPVRLPADELLAEIHALTSRIQRPLQHRMLNLEN